MVDPEFRVAITRGHDDWGNRGPFEGKCPYRYRYAGAWTMGRQHARKGFSIEQTYREFIKLGYARDS